MNGVVGVALADLRQRTRTFALLLVLAVALEFGYLFVPDASAPYVTVDLAGWRGLYDSAWMGATTALLTAVLLPLVGFFLVRPALLRDGRLGMRDIIACAPLSRVQFVLGKFASNMALLALIALLLLIAAIVMQLVRAESSTLELGAYLLPFAIVTVPACALTAAGAVLIDALAPLRGLAGAALWFFAWNALLAIPMLSAAHGGIAAFDPLGLTTVTSALGAGLHTIAAGADDRQQLSVGFVFAEHLRTFRFGGIAWSAENVLPHVAWTAIATAACVLVAPFALQAKPIAAKPRATAVFARVLSRLPLPPLGRLELIQAFDLAGTPWTLGMFALLVAALVLPNDAVQRAIAPLIWIWPVAATAALSVMDIRGLDDVLLATPVPVAVRVVWRWLAAMSLTVLPVGALALRAGPGAPALIAIAAALAAGGLSLGVFTRAPLAYEAAVLAAWYLGPVNHVPLLDPAQSVRAPIMVTAVAVTIGLLALSATSARLAVRR